MKRLLTVFLATLLMVGSSATIASAQDATPDVDEVDAPSVVDPAVGDTVPYIAGGNEVASVTVTDVVRGWADYEEGDDPDLGNEYVGFVIEVEGLASGVVDVDDGDFSLQDVEGYLFDSANVSIDAEAPPSPSPLIEDVGVSDGESVEFVAVFEVPDGHEFAHLFWLPDSDRQITVAQLEGE